MKAGVWPAVLLIGAALALWAPGSALAGMRARRLTGLLTPRSAPTPATGTVSSARRRWALAGAAGLAAGLLVGGAAGACAAVVTTVTGQWLLRAAEADPGEAVRTALERELPVACELIAGCLAAGLPVTAALAAVGGAAPDPLGAQLRRIAALSRLGAEDRQAWADVPAPLAALGRVLVRAGESGAAAVPALRALAQELRSSARSEAQAAVQRAGVWVLAPLGLCFLPAFVCLGVVPLVLGIAGEVFR
ncbi:type II secretion system F family protein [Blastococcus saxobsidens]|uniref:Type II secretion system (T2SS) protein F n=1 Tax=Blastococcus saxobsidens TaxID=138336 RepID=A0A4Q7YD83_9ACTN|nr:type II secretion system F family protein [Blastococcus saxobsidens]RZU34281.1 type II secretion system (T2SS) protein F [Blastococcus saxobsidens]